ncbi:maleylpyruvate isomerase family mycothiol-dependent enzyme [Arthrobacter antibioticus]|uniref:maleylpyruvate isomerase family mycothiol-dependent enzyme n=1 Tax=Arthrobacter sp. H35-MC1 TaxID=3046203 RepID=UPI0024BA8771|nr:maleylpyruvate isomerase family mycothiol-dependent enzyme [Arthrobacter sp. H35-MC1]MDJ0315842.1 maleylpyruvate isomerase family mycothiol-dependent enzyme [Arthrobacter sp. H35-MC1]
MTNLSNAEIWAAVHFERQALIEDLSRLEPDKWRTPSSCPGWDVHDVLAHLVDSAKTTRLGFVRRMVAAGFDFDRDNAVGITREKAANSDDTLNAFQEVRSHTATPPAALVTRLVEVFLHGEDIRRPLKIRRNYPPAYVSRALAYQVKTSVKMGGGKEEAHGLRLIATDTSFEHGDGPEVHGPAIVLLLAVSGRPVEADELTGPGARNFVTTPSEES